MTARRRNINLSIQNGTQAIVIVAATLAVIHLISTRYPLPAEIAQPLLVGLITAVIDFIKHHTKGG